MDNDTELEGQVTIEEMKPLQKELPNCGELQFRDLPLEVQFCILNFYFTLEREAELQNPQWSFLRTNTPLWNFPTAPLQVSRAFRGAYLSVLMTRRNQIWISLTFENLQKLISLNMTIPWLAAVETMKWMALSWKAPLPNSKLLGEMFPNLRTIELDDSSALACLLRPLDKVYWEQDALEVLRGDFDSFAASVAIQALRPILPRIHSDMQVKFRYRMFTRWLEPPRTYNFPGKMLVFEMVLTRQGCFVRRKFFYNPSQKCAEHLKSIRTRDPWETMDEDDDHGGESRLRRFKGVDYSRMDAEDFICENFLEER